MTSTDEFLALTVTRADGGVVRIGPIGFLHIAEQMVSAFATMAGNTTGAAGASYVIAPYEPRDGETYLPLVPVNASVLAELADDEAEGSEAPFPGLWSRLHAQHGYETAQKVWKAACILMDGPPEESSEADKVVVRLPRALAEMVAAVVDSHMEEYPVDDEWGLIEAVRQLDPERGATMYREHRYFVNGGAVLDRVEKVEIESEFADSDAARAWIKEHGKTSGDS
ncbi:hypothetical protein QFZ75_008044 [Streptomyces sp. V3I8]|uniref:hypothetical protein n=1 Tax=Streptomyces sp. V3I8 TaxID=3042279 RepID=UPI002781C249|nr:hypothetical protein [Streptomyces sp. V3I8]MDQ1041542.1 hypothetical protein [Streptomyces sp. V3I8]